MKVLAAILVMLMVGLMFVSVYPLWVISIAMIASILFFMPQAQTKAKKGKQHVNDERCAGGSWGVSAVIGADPATDPPCSSNQGGQEEGVRQGDDGEDQASRHSQGEDSSVQEAARDLGKSDHQGGHERWQVHHPRTPSKVSMEQPVVEEPVYDASFEAKFWQQVEANLLPEKRATKPKKPKRKQLA